MAQDANEQGAARAARLRRMSQVVLGVALVLAVVLVVLAFVAPAYQGTSTQTRPDGTEVSVDLTRTFVEVNGWWGAVVTAIPLIATLVTAGVLRWGRSATARRLAWLPVLLLFALAVLALASVGLLMLPVALLLGLAVATWSRGRVEDVAAR